ncbi:MAG: antitoxin Xre/MbcA/ParS toxin-binding domain-containing protein [Nitriliruptorales bacterium]
MAVDAASVGEVLGGRKVLEKEIANTADLAEAVEAGLPRASLEIVVERVTGDGREATDLKHRIVPKTTLQRRGARLSPEESERLERLARLMALAEQVWENRDLAREFMTSRQPQLDDERPVDLVRSELAARRAEDLLWTLEYSLPV